MKNMRLTEVATLNTSVDLRIDKEAKVIRSVRLLNRASDRGRDYSERAMNDITRLAEGVRVFDGHRIGGGERSRSVKEQLGQIRNPKRVPEGVVGDFHVSARESWLLEDAESMPETLMMSVDALGRVTRSRGQSRLLVESVNTVSSIDLVPLGATTKSLFESGEENEVELKDLTVTQLREARPDLFESIEADARKVSEADGEVARKLAETDQKLRESAELATAQKKRIDEFEVKEALATKQVEIAKILEEAKLPEEAVTEEFQKLLEGLDPEAAKTAIEDRKKLVESTRPVRPMSTIRGGSSGEKLPEMEGFVAELRA